MEKALLDLTRLGMRFPTPDGEFIALKNVDLQISIPDWSLWLW